MKEGGEATAAALATPSARRANLVDQAAAGTCPAEVDIASRTTWPVASRNSTDYSREYETLTAMGTIRDPFAGALLGWLGAKVDLDNFLGRDLQSKFRRG